MAVETNARIEFSVASVEEWEKVNPKLHQGEPVFSKKPSGKYILKVGAPGGSTYKNSVVVWDQDDAETKMKSTQEAAAQALASKNTASASASAAKASENAAAASKSAAAASAKNAKTSETNASASKTAAANSAITASAKATASANSASAASTSETNAARSASAAATSEENALSSANAASTSAGNAKSSETNASASASAAKASENAAAASKSAAAASAENAKTSEENAKKWDLTQLPSVIDMFYPVGTVYMSADKSKTKTDFPFMQCGTWEEVPANLCLQTGNASEAGTKRSAGLPDIKGHVIQLMWQGVAVNNGAYTFTKENDEPFHMYKDGTDGWFSYHAYFNASNSNSIYGSSDTVQPPAYMVRAWVRTA